VIRLQEEEIIHVAAGSARTAPPLRRHTASPPPRVASSANISRRLQEQAIITQCSWYRQAAYQSAETARGNAAESHERAARARERGVKHTREGNITIAAQRNARSGAAANVQNHALHKRKMKGTKCKRVRCNRANNVIRLHHQRTPRGKERVVRRQ